MSSPAALAGPQGSPRKGRWGRLTSRFAAPQPGGFGWKLENWGTALHVWLFHRSRGHILGTMDGAPVCILYHRGARTGEPRQSPVIPLLDGDRVVIVASIAGNPRHPAWYHNLKADPDVEIEVAGRRRPMRARLASAAEADELWPRLLEVWPAWEDYKRRTSRVFPVFVCEPR
jgi:deazaflavin-dependent oxidoreductase (nitroreductase family)